MEWKERELKLYLFIIAFSFFFLTAAHCVFGLGADSLAVVVGLHDINDYAQEDVYELAAVIPHELYSGTSGNVFNDVAILKLARKIERSDRVQTICLPKSDESVIQSFAVVAGWGSSSDEFASGLTENLQITALKVMNRGPRCDQGGSFDSENMVCAFDDGNQSNVCFGK